MAEFFASKDWQTFLDVLPSIPAETWDTFYSTVVATLFALVIGLPLGVLLVTGEPGGVRPLPRWVMRLLNGVINLLRSVPFLILMIIVIPLSRQLQAVIRKAKGLIQIPQARHQHAAVFEHQQRQQGCGQPQCQPPAAAGLLWLRMLRGLPHHCRGKGYRKKRADINGKAEHCVGCQNQLPAGRLGHAVPQADKQRHKRQKAKGCNRKHQLPSPCCTVLSGDVVSFSATVS